MKRRDSGKAPVMIIAAALVVILLAGGGFFVMKSKGAKKHGKVDKGPAVQMALGEFVVNLADTGEVRYLKTSIVLDVCGEVAAGGGHGEGSGPDPKIRDAAIEVMSSKTFAQLAKPGGKDELKKDIMAAVNKRLEKAEVAEVYFSEFAMQ